MIFSAFQGFCMALADSVPGVSGGTIAFILGFYEDCSARFVGPEQGQTVERVLLSGADRRRLVCWNDSFHLGDFPCTG